MKNGDWEVLLESCSVVSGFMKSGEPLPLNPEAGEAKHQMTPHRRKEFEWGRDCARRALRKLGVEPESVPRDARGAPVWPQGIVGSISHSGGYCVAAVARQDPLSSLGIDVEHIERVREPHLPYFGEDEDIFEIKQVFPSLSNQQCLALLFSAKESVYKSLPSSKQSSVTLKQLRILWRRPNEFDLCPEMKNRALGRSKATSSSGGRFFFSGNWVGTVFIVNI